MADYEVSESTLKILKNFSGISDSVRLRPGTTQRTVSAAKSMMAIADFDVPWPMETPIYQLPELINNLTSYDRPTLTFEEKQFVIRGYDSPSHVEYPYSDASVVIVPPEKNFDLSDPVAVFTLPAKAVAEIKKFSQINNLPTVTIELDGGTASSVIVKPMDEKNPVTRSYSYPVSADPKRVDRLMDGVQQTSKFKREHFDLLLEGEYVVTVGAEWSYVYFKHQSLPVSYFIVLKSSSWNHANFSFGWNDIVQRQSMTVFCLRQSSSHFRVFSQKRIRRICCSPAKRARARQPWPALLPPI